MKKIIALVLAAIMMVAFVACGKNNNDTTTAPNTTTDNNKTTATEATTEAPVVPAASLEDIANAIIACEALSQMRLVTTPMEEGYMPGFDEDITGFEEAYNFGPMIGSIPFVGYIFRVSDASAAQSFLDSIKAKSNPRWNICTSADTTVTEVKGNLVLFVMLNAETLGNDAATQIKTAFNEAAK
ncbi:MAG: hypothetical protein ACI4QR_01975 [Eubacteriales bacterium]